jgi:prophage regulatory protein
MSNMNLLTINEVVERTRLSKPTIYKLINKGCFPKQIHLSDNKVAWLEEEITAWINTRAQARVS